MNLTSDTAFMGGKVYLSSDCQCSLTEWGIFLSSLLLSMTGVISICLLNCRRSNCTEVKLPCLSIKREPMNIEE